jgi:hypothetical protein
MLSLNFVTAHIHTFSGDDIGYEEVTTFLLQRTLEHEKTVSDLRLNKRPQNAALKKGSETLECTQALRKQNKAEYISIKLSIWMYPMGKGKPQQVRL